MPKQPFDNEKSRLGNVIKGFIKKNNYIQLLHAQSSHTDTALTALLRQGNEAAFTEIFNRYWDKLYFIAHKHLKSSQASEEIVQDVFMTLWEKRESLSIHSLPLYLAAMTRYAVYHNLAWQKKHKSVDMHDLKADYSTNRDLEYLDNKLLLEIIEKLSNQLPNKCRMVFVQNKLLDIPLQQVADDMNISPKTAEAHLTKALKSMRMNLGDAFSVLFIF